MKERLGLSLAGVLVTSFLVLLIVGLVAVSTSEYSQIVRFSATSDQLLQAAQVTLKSLASEGPQALEFLAPTGTSPTPQVEFIRLTRPSANRLPPDPTAGPGYWDPWGAADTETVSYRVQGQELIRVVQSGATTTSRVVATEVAGFSAALLDPKLIRVELSINDGGRIQTLAARVHLPQERR